MSLRKQSAKVVRTHERRSGLHPRMSAQRKKNSAGVGSQEIIRRSHHILEVRREEIEGAIRLLNDRRVAVYQEMCVLQMEQCKHPNRHKLQSDGRVFQCQDCGYCNRAMES